MHEVSDSSAGANQDEIELIRTLYPDLVQVLGPNSVRVQLTADIEVVFTLPNGYPTKSPPKHTIFAPAHLDHVRNQINEQLEANYRVYTGYPILAVCIVEINSIANNYCSHKRPASPEDPNLEQTPREEFELAQRPTKRFNWISSEIREDRWGKFQAHLVRIKSRNEAIAALAQLREYNGIACATHTIYAFRVVTPEGRELAEHEDDGENAAGAKLMRMLKRMTVKNMMVVVTRWCDEIHADNNGRFRHVCKLARELVVKYQHKSVYTLTSGSTAKKK